MLASRLTLPLLVAATLAALPAAAAPEAPPAPDLAPLVEAALGADVDAADAAVAALRDAGQPAVDALLAAVRTRLGLLATLPGRAYDRYDAVLDRVAGQRLARNTGLYWFTDLERAEAEARRTGRPILSLRLLGRLDEQYSCANSRFFRALIYSDPRVKERLRDGFVLHWEPVRDTAPRITIDLGHGKVIERTITGNSAHLLLDAEGRPLDALPGLVGAATFARWLDDGVALAKAVAPGPGGARPARTLAEVLTERREALMSHWQAELAAIGVRVPKTLVELRGATGPRELELLAGRRAAGARLGAPARSLVEASQPPDARLAATLAITKARVETPMLRVVSNVEADLARDEVTNALMLHAQVLSWLAAAPRTDRRTLVEAIYRDLFLSPLDDPYFGLRDPDVFTGLDPAPDVAAGPVLGEPGR